LACAAVVAGAIVTEYRSALAKPQSEKPAALRLFEQSRERINAEFSVTSHGPGKPGKRYRCIIVNDQFAVFADGSPCGITGYTPDRRPVYGKEEAVLTTEDAIWQNYQSSPGGTLRTGRAAEDRSNSLDFRSLGMTAMSSLICAPSEVYPPRKNGVLQEVEYAEELDPAGIHIVRGTNKETGLISVWYIDPSLDWNAVRVEDWQDGRRVACRESTYERINNTWVLTKITTLSSGDEVLGVTDLRYAKVNSPDLPQQLTPTDIGFHVGTNVYVDNGVMVEHRIWDGEQAVPTGEFYERVRAGQLEFDPRVLAQLRDSRGMRIGSPDAPPATMPVTTQPASSPAEWRLGVDARLQRWLARGSPGSDPWDVYVARFIERGKLDADQTERCLAILKDCKERRDSIIQQRRDRLEKLAQQPVQTESDARILEEQIDRIVAPAEKVLADMKSRLERVPTRKQLEDAGLARDRKD
jgi:hypothetical protein